MARRRFTRQSRRATRRQAVQQTRQEKAAAAQAAAARAAAQRRSLIAGVGVLAVVAVVVGIFAAVLIGRHNAAVSGGASPSGFDSSYSVTVGRAKAPVTVVAYEDFGSPACKDFEDSDGAQLAGWVKQGRVKVQYRPIALPGKAAGGTYSTRALNATAALVTLKPSAFAGFHQALFANQPTATGPGPTDQKLIELAVAAGAPKDAITTAVTRQTYKTWTARATDAFFKAGYTRTPTVIVNGKPLADAAPATMRAAVAAALAAAKK